VQEVPLVAADLDSPRAQELEQPADRSVVLEVERQQVAILTEAALGACQLLGNAPARELRFVRVPGLTPRQQRFGCGLRTE